jgi:hypothetical protein
MGVELNLWRARVGAFNNGCTTLQNSCKIDKNNGPVIPASWNFLFGVLCFTCMLLLLVTPIYIWVALMCFTVVILIRLVSILIITCVIKLSLRSFSLVGNPRSLIYGLATIGLLSLFVPGFIHISVMVFNPNLDQLIIQLSGDVHPNPGPISSLKVMFTNVNSLMAENGQRLSELHLRLKTESIDIACICETGPNLNLKECNITGYHVLDDCFYEKTGRGLLVYVHESIIAKRRPELEKADGCLWLECFVEKNTLLLGVFYRSPSQNVDARTNFFRQMDDSLDLTLKSKSDVVLFILYDLSIKHSLSQFIHQPTRITNSSKSCLDLIFCNHPGFILDTDVVPPISLSDHSCTIATLDISTLIKKQTLEHTFWKYGQADLDTLNTEVRNYNWDNVLGSNDIDVMTNSFTNSLFTLLSNNIPNVKRVVRGNDMPWFDHRVRKAMNNRNKCYRRMLKNHSGINHEKFKDSASKVSEVVRKAKADYHNRLCNTLDSETSGTKNYWYTIKKLLGKKFCTGIPILISGNDTYSLCKEKCKIFLDSFQEKFHHNLDETIIPNFPSKCLNTLENILTTEDTVRKLLLDLNVSKQGGDDGITNKMLKLIANPLSCPLSRLFNRILQEGVFPNCWKHGILVPIYKNKGSKSLIVNYRPVILLNSLSKLFEKVVFQSIFDHFLRNDLFYKYQSGFMPGHGTERQLISICHKIQSVFF